MLYLILSVYIVPVIAGAVYKFVTASPIRWADIFNPIKWWSVVVSAVVSTFIPFHIVEQLAIRIYDKECFEMCVSQGSCYHCGCKMPAKAFDPMASCSKGNWGPMILSKKEYKQHRKQYPIKITVKHGQI